MCKEESHTSSQTDSTNAKAESTTAKTESAPVCLKCAATRLTLILNEAMIDGLLKGLKSSEKTVEGLRAAAAMKDELIRRDATRLAETKFALIRAETDLRDARDNLGEVKDRARKNDLVHVEEVNELNRQLDAKGRVALVFGIIVVIETCLIIPALVGKLL